MAVAYKARTKVRPNGTNRLSEGEAEQLLDYLDRTPEKDVRAALMMTPELARSCVGYKGLPPEIIARVQQFLAAGKAG